MTPICPKCRKDVPRVLSMRITVQVENNAFTQVTSGCVTCLQRLEPKNLGTVISQHIHRVTDASEL